MAPAYATIWDIDPHTEAKHRIALLLRRMAANHDIMERPSAVY